MEYSRRADIRYSVGARGYYFIFEARGEIWTSSVRFNLVANNSYLAVAYIQTQGCERRRLRFRVVVGVRCACACVGRFH